MSKKPIPKFKNEKEEFEFWSTHDVTDYVDVSQAKPTEFSHLKPSSKTITMRLPEDLLADLKKVANKYDIPYQSYMKFMLAKVVEQEMKSWEE